MKGKETSEHVKEKTNKIDDRTCLSTRKQKL